MTFNKILIILIFILLNNNLFSSESHYNCITSSCCNEDFRNKYLDKLLGDETRPQLQKKIKSNYKKFLIHYDISGNNAVDTTDSNHNNIPDYIDSVAFYFDYSYQIEVEKLGYEAPPIDSMRGGDNLYDIYVMNLTFGDQSIYGYTESEDVYVNQYNTPIANSFIVIDNNYSIEDSVVKNGVKTQAYKTFGIDAVRITSAHEFHHAIQYGYGIPSKYGSLIREMTSTWMEYKVHSTIYDFVQYLTDLYQNLNQKPITIDDLVSGYRWSIFLQYLTKKIDVEIVKDIWDDISKNIDFFTSLETLLKNKYNTDILEVWNDFVPWMYFTSHRTMDSVYFESAKRFPRLRFNKTLNLEDQLTISENILPYQIYGYRIINRTGQDELIDTIDILSSYIVDDYIHTVKDTFKFNIEITNQKNFENKIKYCKYLSFNNSEIQENSKKSVLHIFVNDGINYPDESFAFTNPNNPLNEELFVSLPLESKSDKFEIAVFNSEMTQIYNKIEETSIFNGNYGVRIENSRLKNGIYYYHIFNQTKNYYGKFTILRK